jgi:hypothetical protein
MTDFFATSRDMSGRDFLDAIGPLFGKPDEQREAELARAFAEHKEAMQQTFSIPKLWDQIIARDALRAEYEARVEEIESGLQLTEVCGDPLLKRGVT